MPLDLDAVTHLHVEPIAWSPGEAIVTWKGPAPPGARFQVYVDRVLVATTTERRAFVAIGSERATVHVGVIAPGDADEDLAAEIPDPPGGGDRARVAWSGGTYLDPTGGDDIVAFAISGESSPGAGIDESSPLAEVAAYPGGVPLDGFGMGGFGMGGFGRAATDYEWHSAPLPSGTWAFRIRALRAGGRLGPAVDVSAAIAAPPEPPPLVANGARLAAAFDPGTGAATLTWEPSPSA